MSQAHSRVVMVDALNIARYGRPRRGKLPPLASYSHLMAAVQELRGHFPDKYIHLEADANFVVAMEPNECAEAQAACDRGEVELVVRDRQADNWLLNLADKYDAIVVTADNLTPFTGPYPWILHWGRVWGPEYSRRFDRWGFGPRILDRENRSTKGRLDPREINQTQALRQSVDYGIADKSELQEPLMQLDMEWYTEPNQHEVDCTLTTANGMLEVTEQSRATGYSFNNSRFEISWCTAPLGRFGTNLRRTSLSNSFLNVEVEEDGEVFLVSRSSSDGDIEWWSSLPYRHPDRRRNSHSSSLQPTPNWAIEASLDGRMVGVNEIGSEDIWFVSTSRQAVPYERKTSREVIALGEVSNSRPCWGLANDFYSLSRTGKLFVGLAEHEIAWHPPDSKSKPGRYRIVDSHESRILISRQNIPKSAPSWWVVDLNTGRQTHAEEAECAALESGQLYSSKDGYLSCTAGDFFSRQLWRVPYQGSSILGMYGGTLLTANFSNDLVAFDKTTGRPMWGLRSAMGLPKYWASDDVIAYQSDYSMWIRSAQDGSLLGRYQSGEQPVEVQVPIPDWIVTKGPKSQLTAFHLH